MTRKRLFVGIIISFLFFPLHLLAQDRVVTGKVTSSRDGLPVIGASVLPENSSVGTTTGSDGTFSLRVSAGVQSLIISSVGFTDQVVDIAGKTSVTVTLVAVAIDLNEIVVIGYGTTRKKDLTGAVAVVNAKDFQKGAIITPEQLISGKVAGVQISTNSGAPGSGSRIRIRGGASLNASNDPLLVIDGVPVDNGGVAGSVNPLNLINPADIESFTVLKDPSAAAIYGSRASNGVIIITTKKGKRGKPTFNAGLKFFAQQPSGTVDVLTAEELRSIINVKGSTSEADRLGSANTDWQDEIYHTAFGQDITLSSAGSIMNGQLPFRISGGFLNQDGILRTGNFQRQTISINLSPRLLNNNLRVDINIKGARTTSRFANEGAIGSAIAFDPTQPVKVNSNRFGGFFEYVDENTNGAPPRDLAPRNPVSLLEMRDDRSEVFRSIGNLQLDYSLPWVQGLKANLNLGFDYQQGDGTVLVPDSAASTYRRWDISENPFVINHFGGINNIYQNERSNLLFDFYFNYVKTVSSLKSRFDITAGTGYQDFLFINYAYPDRRYDKSIRPGTEPQFPKSKPRYTLISYYGRLNYTLLEKYLLTFNVRTDGTSRFNPDERWGIFPSAAFAWKVSDENFLIGNKVINDLKLRFGYGVTGQQDGISFYGYLPSYSISNNAATYQLGNEFFNLYRPSAYDPTLRWETTTNLNAAIDFGLFNNRISGSVDVFYRKTKDLLSVVPIPLGTNFSNQLLTNVGNIESRGVEVTLNTTPVQNDKVTWDFGVNLTYINPKVTKLLLNPDPSFKGNRIGGIAGGTGNTIQIHSVDYRPFTYFVYKQVYDENNKPIEGLYEDLNRDGIINDDDLYRYKSPDARVYMGFNSTVTFGKWDAGFVARASIGNYNYHNVQSNLGALRQILNPLGWIVNASANYLETNFTNNQYFSDYYVQNASFFRMDNINVGYDAGQVIKGSNLRLSFNVQNAFVITKYEGLDPELNGGIDNNLYPRPRMFVLGANLDF